MRRAASSRTLLILLVFYAVLMVRVVDTFLPGRIPGSNDFFQRWNAASTFGAPEVRKEGG